METKNIKHRIALAILAIACFILLSPKWLFPPAAWVAPIFLIALINQIKPWKSYVLAVSLLFLSSLVAYYKVMPFPGIFFVIMVLIMSLQTAVPFWLNRLLYPRLMGWKKTLVLPVALVAFEYINSFGGGGTWGSLAYTQVSNFHLIQTASLTGIWGITFLIGWFASIFVWVMDEHWNWTTVSKTVVFFGATLLSLLLYGLIKTNPYFSGAQKTVRVAGITGSNIAIIQSMYEDVFGKWIDVKEEELSQTSPELAELNKGFVQYVEDPFDQKFKKTRLKLTALQDSLLARSGKEAAAGAKIISWSEALTFVIKSEEEELIKRGQSFARENHVYFLMTMASITPGKVEIGAKFMENKAILIGPSGQTLNVFFKNRPVPVVEPSVAGNGYVPVTDTPFGKLATSICYDADFPQLMQQVGGQEADILFLPSGDWKEISPYHAQMAVVRAIENGVSLLRTVSGAQSIATDFHGRIIGSRNYYDDGEKALVAYLPVKGINTVYGLIGDALAWLCIAGLILLLVFSFLNRKITPSNKFLISNQWSWRS